MSTTGTLVYRPIQPEDIDGLVVLNNNAAPAVNTLSVTELMHLVEHSQYHEIALLDGNAVGLLIVFEPGCDYDSANYRWFNQNYEQFAYVDRIAVLPNLSRMRIGSTLYQRLFQHYPDRPICCEVNTEPPNPQSMAFHKNKGFKRVGELSHPEVGKEVVLLMREAQ